MALNPNLAAAHTQMGRIKQQLDFDWAGGDASYQRAVELEPGNPEAVNGAASSAAILGRFDEALRLNRRAVDLDPLNAGSWESLGETEFFMGQLDEAAADVKKSLELNPDVWPGPIMLSQIYVLQGRPQDALPEIERVRDESQRASLYAIAYHALGRKQESDAALSELITKHQQNTYRIAEVYAFRNQSDEAFEWLDRAYGQRNAGLIETKVEPSTEELAPRPAIRRVIEEAQLPDLKYVVPQASEGRIPEPMKQCNSALGVCQDPAIGEISPVKQPSNLFDSAFYAGPTIASCVGHEDSGWHR